MTKQFEKQIVITEPNTYCGVCGHEFEFNQPAILNTHSDEVYCMGCQEN